MLDTNAVSAFLRRRSPRLDGWVREQRCCLSAIVAAEIRYGLEKRPPTSQFKTRLRALAALDLLIASHALSEGCVLVSAEQAFALVDELTLEAW